jgi:hypothetical protein
MGQQFADKGRFFATIGLFPAERFRKTFKLGALDIPKAGPQCLKAPSQVAELLLIHDIADDSIM